jgi:hypothetical protein
MNTYLTNLNKDISEYSLLELRQIAINCGLSLHIKIIHNKRELLLEIQKKQLELLKTQGTLYFGQY